MRVMALDLGFCCGYGVVGRNYIRSGTHRLDGGSSQMGAAFRSLRATVLRIVDKHQPDHLCAAIPYVAMKANPINLIPIMGFYCRLQEIADEISAPFYPVNEARARKAFLSPIPIPRKSVDIKRAIHDSCKQRGWPSTDDHATDALCVAHYLLATLDQDDAVTSLPLFAA